MGHPLGVEGDPARVGKRLDHDLPADGFHPDAVGAHRLRGEAEGRGRLAGVIVPVVIGIPGLLAAGFCGVIVGRGRWGRAAAAGD